MLGRLREEPAEGLQRWGVVRTLRAEELTSDLDGTYILGAGARAGPGFLYGWHVTDDPAGVLRALRRGDIGSVERPSARYDDLGPGLYFSAAPQHWRSRAASRWRFLDGLSSVGKKCLGNALLALEKFRAPGYLTENEIAIGRRDIGYFVSRSWGSIDTLLGQPWNCGEDLSRDRWALVRACGIEPTEAGQSVEVRAAGDFAIVDRYLAQVQWRRLRAWGFDGAIMPGGWAGAPQTVVYAGSAVLLFGDQMMRRGGTWHRPSGRRRG